MVIQAIFDQKYNDVNQGLTQCNSCELQKNTIVLVVPWLVK